MNFNSQESYGKLAPLVITQALSGFNNNQLRAALLMAATFDGLTIFDLSAGSIIGLTTIAIVAPFFLLSIPAGRLSDRFPKQAVLMTCKLFEVVIFLLAAYGLTHNDVGILLVALFLAGIEATLLGPAKFGLLPELVSGGRLIGANAIMSASNVVAILLGVISGTIVAVLPDGHAIIAVAGVLIALAGLGTSLLIPRGMARAPGLAIRPSAFVSDVRLAVFWLRDVPLIQAPLAGIAWFWFQGTLNTNLFTLLVQQARGLTEHFVTLLFITATVGAALGALLCNVLKSDLLHARIMPLFPLAALAGSSLYITLAGPLEQGLPAVAALAAILVLSVGSGFYVVPLTAALQAFAPPTERGRYIGLANTLSGLTMLLSGLAGMAGAAAGMAAHQMFVLTGVTGGAIAYLTLRATLPALRATGD